MEHGEFEGHYYGTAVDSIRRVANSGKHCILNLHCEVCHNQLYDLAAVKPYIAILAQDTLLLEHLSSPGVYKWVLANLMLGGNPVMDQHHIQGGVEILLVTSCYRNWDKFWPDGPPV